MEAKIKEKSTNATEEDDLLEGEGSGDETTTLATGLRDLQTLSRVKTLRTIINKITFLIFQEINV